MLGFWVVAAFFYFAWMIIVNIVPILQGLVKFSFYAGAFLGTAYLVQCAGF